MDEALLAAYLATDYRVRLGGGGWASIHIDQKLPAEIRPLVGPRAWGFITAWNPRSQPLPRQQNRLAQRALLRALHTQAGVEAIHPAVGVGRGRRWKEPSLFVIGLGTEALDRLSQQFGQRAYLHGNGDSPARLHLIPTD